MAILYGLGSFVITSACNSPTGCPESLFRSRITYINSVSLFPYEKNIVYIHFCLSLFFCSFFLFFFHNFLITYSYIDGFLEYIFVVFGIDKEMSKSLNLALILLPV